MTTVESILTRKLGITFLLDARTLANEAKLALRLEGYPTEAQKLVLVQESERLFAKNTSVDKQFEMQQRRSSLEMAKKREVTRRSSFQVGSTTNSSNNDSVSLLSGNHRSDSIFGRRTSWL